MFTTVGATLVPEALDLVRQRAPEVRVVSREGSTPAVIRGLRAGTLDLAVISARPPYPAPDDREPGLVLDILLEGDLLVALPADGALGQRGTVTLAELQSATWISSPHSTREPGMGVWPALPQRPLIAHEARDWLSKLALVAAGWGVTTLPPYLIGLVPDGVRLVRVADGAPVTRRVLLARLPGRSRPAVDQVRECLTDAAGFLPLA